MIAALTSWPIGLAMLCAGVVFGIAFVQLGLALYDSWADQHYEFEATTALPASDASREEVVSSVGNGAVLEGATVNFSPSTSAAEPECDGRSASALGAAGPTRTAP